MYKSFFLTYMWRNGPKGTLILLSLQESPPCDTNVESIIKIWYTLYAFLDSRKRQNVKNGREPVLGIRDILAADPDPYLWHNLPGTHRHIILSLKNLIFCESFVLKSYFASIISVDSTSLWEKGRIHTTD